MFFSQARRGAIKAANPSATFGDVGKLLGAAWKAAGPEERAPFDAQAAADADRYKADMVAWKEKEGAAAAAKEEPAAAE